jgi:hypothetical protein
MHSADTAPSLKRHIVMYFLFQQHENYMSYETPIYWTNKIAFTVITMFSQNKFLCETTSGICVAQHPTNIALLD